jgi:acyl-[acyl-carrier-protein]-phospholipid O-acyltransferase/long-chain-fatty-acid--[acyl-carrier-protein] ligase
MGAQSTFFSPAKYGILPEAFAPRHLPRANGMMELTRILAVIFGTGAGGAALGAWGDRPALVGLAFVAIALVGFLASLGIMPAARPGPRQAFHANPWGEITGGVARLARDRLLGPVVAGTTFFDFLSTLVMLDVLLVAKEIMGLDDLNTSLLAVMIGLGLGAGALAAGRLLGPVAGTWLVPLGACGVGLALVALALSTQSYGRFVASLLALGFCGGLYLIPLNTLLQRKAGRNEKGRLIATNNFVNMAGVLAASGTLWLLRDLLDIQADGILLLTGLSTLVVGAGIVCVPRLLRSSPSRLRC